MTANLDQETILGNIRALSVEMASIELLDQDLEYLKVAENIMRQVRADGSPLFPIHKHLEKKLQEKHGPDFDLDICIDYYIQTE